MSVAKKIFKIKNELSSIYRNADGYKFKYPTLTTIKNEIDPRLEAEGVVIIPSIQDITDNIYTFIVDVIDVNDDDSLQLTFTVKGDTQQQNSVQSSGATMSYMQRYIPKLLFDLDFVDDDPDHKKNSTPKKQAEGVKTFKEQLKTYCNRNKIELDQAAKVMKEVANKTKASELTQKEYNAVINKLDTMQRTN
jgi:hypothetical protein